MEGVTVEAAEEPHDGGGMRHGDRPGERVEGEAEDQQHPTRRVRDPLGDRGHGPRSGQDTRRRGQSRQRKTPAMTAPWVGQGRQKWDEIYRIGQRLR
ncbi:hypothetical protein GCM10010420_55070 [Streptomyces glaucosporus]|uniref:Uncharacterized protein n=1 Tax=Streptomyces glaucosporus TaxID=284044 RepID=A0ABP5W1Y4_9ACTN